MAGVFVTGTDTGVGKTVISAMLIEGLKARGLAVAGMKPVASGAVLVNGLLSNEDVLTLLKASSQPLAYPDANIYTFEPPVSPNIAAKLAGEVIDLDLIGNRFSALENRFDVVVVEGVGGWAVPLNERESITDLAARLVLPIVLVVGLRLGCINHALLTEQSILRARLPLLGWVSNQVDENLACGDEVVEALKRRLESPCLGSLGYHSEIAGDKALNPVMDLAGEVLRRLAL